MKTLVNPEFPLEAAVIAQNLACTAESRMERSARRCSRFIEILGAFKTRVRVPVCNGVLGLSVGAYLAGLLLLMFTLASSAESPVGLVKSAQRAELVITSAPPPGGRFSESYFHKVTTNGSPAPTVVVLQTGALPPGLTLNGNSGEISGTPLSVGTFVGTLRASNGVDIDATQSFSISIAGVRPGAATITSITVGDGVALVYFDPPSFTGGLPVFYNVLCSMGGTVGSGSSSPIATTDLPNGVPMNCYVNTINSVGYTLTPPFGPVVLGVAPSFSNAALSSGHFGVPYSATLTATGAPAPSFSLRTGSLPDGLTLDPSGVISGTPTLLGTFNGSFSATNGVGDPATQSFSITIFATAPAAPTIGTAVASNGAVSVSFQAPTNTGGTDITGYRATCASQGADGQSSPINVTGLSNGVAVSCRVIARSSVGDSVASAPSNTVTPATVPGAPTLGAAIPGLGSVSISFTAPSDNGGSSISGYRATCGSQSAVGTDSPITVSGLPSGIPVTCRVLAQNAIGDGAASALSASVTPQGLPAAPEIGLATPGVSAVSIAFSPPSNTGGLLISGYRASCGGQSANGLNSPITVVGLTNGVPVSCRVIASNALGDSVASASSNTVTPAGVPSAPALSSVTPGNGSATLSFSVSSDNGGSPITGYSASCIPGTHIVNGGSSPLTVGGLNNDVIYTCSVSAINALGNSPASPSLNVLPSTSTSADLSVFKSNSTQFVSGAYPVVYLIEVTNAGPAGVAGARVVDTLADVFSNASWSCSGQNGARCARQSGTGDLDERIDMPPASNVRFLITATLAPFPENPVSNIASATTSSAISDPVLSNNVGSDGPDIVGLKRDGFE